MKNIIIALLLLTSISSYAQMDGKSNSTIDHRRHKNIYINLLVQIYLEAFIMTCAFYQLDKMAPDLQKV